MSDSESDDDNDIRYGTPLEPYEEDEIPSKRNRQQPPDQFAFDAHGRRRFHGAFTGGFSAGYGNTVGTPEGWTPATFKSSRSEKAQLSTQKPEDFMDEDDRSEYGIAPKQLHTQSDFSGQKRPRQQSYHDGPIPGEPVLQQLVRAVHETAAVGMLKAMGWRPGQGAGCRVTREERKLARQRHKVYGCYVPPEFRQNTEHNSGGGSDSSDSEFEYDTLFAPEDYEPYILQHKNDCFGLGYSGLSRHSVLGNLVGEYGQASTSTSQLVIKDKGKKLSIRGQAFGVGALEKDDDDIYAVEDMSHYDFTLGDASDRQQKKKEIKQKDNHILEGFVNSTKPLPSVPSYPPPELPRYYIPLQAGAKRSRFEPTTQAPRDQGLGRHELTAEARGALLGESPVQRVSEQANIQTDKQDIIAKITGRNVDFISTIDNNTSTEKTNLVIDKTKPNNTNPNENNVSDYISIKDSGKDFVPLFKPFAGNYQKQSRYEKFLKDREGYISDRDGVIDKLSEWESERELVEFEQAAKLYKPLTGVMGDRFTHASQPDDATNTLSAVAKSCSNYGLATPEQIEAAKKGLYGVITRTQVDWRPEATVCKRFNVPVPGGSRPDAAPQEKPKVSYSIFSYMESSVHDKSSFMKEQTTFSGSKSLAKDTISKPKEMERPRPVQKPQIIADMSTSNKRMTVAELFLKESEKAVEKEAEVTKTIDKFDKMDLYKSIFLSDSENEEDCSITKEKGSVNDFIDPPKNIERNDSPPRGIFANIDFDELNSWRRKPEEKSADPTSTDSSTKDAKSAANSTTLTINNNENSRSQGDKNEIEVENIYGPKIPESILKRLEIASDNVKETDNFKPAFRSKSDRGKPIEVDSSSNSESWVDVKEVSKKVKKKKNKKHSKAKHKKSKHKKRSQ